MISHLPCGGVPRSKEPATKHTGGNVWGRATKSGSGRSSRATHGTFSPLLNSTAIVRVGALGVALSGALFAAPAWADCTPAAANGVTATCTGTTINQGGGAPGTSASFEGYGTGFETGVTVTVASGAGNTVTGGNRGIFIGDGTVINNAGASIAGDVSGIWANSGGTINVTNFGNITSTGNGGLGIFAQGSADVTNSGQITGDFVGLLAVNAKVTNNAGGIIQGNNSGIMGGIVDVTNFGSITGGSAGIIALSGGSSVFNAGTISGGTAAIQFSGTGNTLTLAQSSVITGNVLGTGSDTLRLGGTANGGSFDVSSLSELVGGSEQYQGFAHFEKTGNTAWTVTGTSTYSGDVTINGGILYVTGSLASVSSTTVNNSGVLSGTGTMSAVQVNAGGAIAPGDGATPGQSMTVASLAMQSGALYVVNLNPSTSSFVNVTGNASLGGATVQAFFAPGSYVHKQYTILSAAGGLGGTTFNPVVNSNNANLQSTLSYGTNNAYLNIQLLFNPPSGGLNANQQNAANAVTNYFNTTGSIPTAFTALTPNGLTQVSGELGTGSQQTTYQAMNLFMGLMTDPFSPGRGVVNNGPTAFADESESMAYAGRAKSKSPRDAFAAYTKAPPAVFAQRWNVWAAGYGGSQSTDGNVFVGSNNTTSSVYGAAAGADYWFSPDTVAGFALAGGGTNYSVANGGSGRSDLFQAGAFVRHNIGATYITASAAYGWQDVTTDRYVSVTGVDHLRANFDANSYSGRLELGHRFLTPWFGRPGVSPYAAVQTTAFELPSYNERAVSGASTFALNYGADTTTSSRTELGLRSDKSFALEGAVLTLRGRAAWAHDFNPDRAVAATFQSLPGASFIVNGAALASDAALTTASAEVRWLNGWSVAGTFEGEFSEVTRSYAGKGVVRYNW